MLQLCFKKYNLILKKYKETLYILALIWYNCYIKSNKDFLYDCKI